MMCIPLPSLFWGLPPPKSRKTPPSKALVIPFATGGLVDTPTRRGRRRRDGRRPTAPVDVDGTEELLALGRPEGRSQRVR